MGHGEMQIVLLAEAAGGVMRHVIELYKGLKEKNHRVKVVLSPLRIESRYMKELRELSQEDIVYVPMRRAPHGADIGALLKIRGILRNARGKVILHTHSTKAGFIGSLLLSHVHASVHTPHAYRGIDPNLGPVARAVFQRIEGFYSRKYDRVIAEVPFEFAHAMKIGVPQDTLRLIPNGIDMRGECFDRLYKQRQQLPDRITLGFVGRLVYQKNPLLFVEVLNAVVQRGCDARAIVVGDGPLKEEMMKMAQRRGIEHRIDWRGETPIDALLPEMDVLVHTSVYEALPYTLLDACRSLLPIVATDNDGSRAILGEHIPQNISPSRDPNEISSIVLSLVSDNSIRLAQLRSLNQIAHEYSMESMVAKIEAEYYALLN